MPRYPLIHVPGGLYSVVSKCNNNDFMFDAFTKIDLYIDHLLTCKRKFRFKMYDIVCMSNHIHELYGVPENGVTISDILHDVRGHFSRKFNKRYGRTGHFWRNKAWYRLVEDERYAIAICRYFHANPVRAGIVQHPSEWPYSGYCFHELGDKTGTIGELLDPLPGSEETSKRQPLSEFERMHLEKLLRKRSRYIGGGNYIRKMKRKFG